MIEIYVGGDPGKVEKDPTGILIDGYVTQEQLVILHLIYEWIATEREPFKL